MLRSIGLMEVLVILFVLGIPVCIVVTILVLRSRASSNPLATSAHHPKEGAFCIGCRAPLAPGVVFCSKCGARRG
jgi:hypothetical protein